MGSNKRKDYLKNHYSYNNTRYNNYNDEYNNNNCYDNNNDCYNNDCYENDCYKNDCYNDDCKDNCDTIVVCKSSIYNNTIFVDSEFGDDCTGKPRQFKNPFKTINAAIFAIPCVPTYCDRWSIVCRPGVYTLNKHIDLPSHVDLVNWIANKVVIIIYVGQYHGDYLIKVKNDSTIKTIYMKLIYCF